MHGSRILVFVVAWWHGPLLVNFLVFSPLELLNNGTNHDVEVHIPEVPLTPYDDKEDVGTISTSETDAIYIICLKTILHGGIHSMNHTYHTCIRILERFNHSRKKNILKE